MRKVKCKYYSYKDRVWINIEEGKFHGWGVTYEEFDSGPGNYTIGIIELLDGKIINCIPTDIEFLD